MPCGTVCHAAQPMGFTHLSIRRRLTSRVNTWPPVVLGDRRPRAAAARRATQSRPPRSEPPVLRGATPREVLAEDLEPAFTIGPAFVRSDAICSIVGEALVKAGQRGRPASFGSYVFAQLVQCVRSMSDIASSFGVAGGRLCSLSCRNMYGSSEACAEPNPSAASRPGSRGARRSSRETRWSCRSSPGGARTSTCASRTPCRASDPVRSSSAPESRRQDRQREPVGKRTVPLAHPVHVCPL
jgi:hypothetical protein